MKVLRTFKMKRKIEIKTRTISLFENERYTTQKLPSKHENTTKRVECWVGGVFEQMHLLPPFAIFSRYISVFFGRWRITWQQIFPKSLAKILFLRYRKHQLYHFILYSMIMDSMMAITIKMSVYSAVRCTIDNDVVFSP